MEHFDLAILPLSSGKSEEESESEQKLCLFSLTYSPRPEFRNLKLQIYIKDYLKDGLFQPPFGETLAI